MLLLSPMLLLPVERVGQNQPSALNRIDQVDTMLSQADYTQKITHKMLLAGRLLARTRRAKVIIRFYWR